MFADDDFNPMFDMINFEDDLFQEDVTTVSGKNAVLDFIAQVKFEIQLVGWSKTAGKIAKFYDTCGGYYKFMFNPVVKMILREIEYEPQVKKYLNQRIFQYISKDKIKDLDRIFNHSDAITHNNKLREKEYFDFKEKVNHRIREYNEDLKTAEYYVKLLTLSDNCKSSKGIMSLFKQRVEELLNKAKTQNDCNNL